MPKLIKRSSALVLVLLVWGCSNLKDDEKKSPAESPTSLLGFGCSTHPTEDGAVICRLDFPEDTSRFKRVDLRRSPVNLPENCQDDGELVHSLETFEDQDITDQTEASGEVFGYRVCVFGGNNTLLSDLTAINIVSLNLATPNALQLTCVPGNRHGGIMCTTRLANKGSIDQLVLRRIKGLEAPNADCQSDGEVVAKIEIPRGYKEILDLVPEELEDPYSYRLCGYDLLGRVISQSAVEGVIPRDLLPPNAPGFSCQTSDSVEGGIKCDIKLPKDANDYVSIKVLRAKGIEPPAYDCEINGSVIFETSDIKAQSFVDKTGNRAGALFSYRICVSDKDSNLNSDKSVSGVQARDTTAPNQLKGFACKTGTRSEGEIECEINFPADTEDYARVEVRRLKGSEAPSEDCSSNGVSVLELLPDYQDQTLSDFTGEVNGTAFSYRVCIFDSSNYLTSVQTASGIMSRDTTPPRQLSRFTCTADPELFGNVACRIDFPSQTSDYAYVDIRHLPSSWGPNRDCKSDGSTIRKLYPSFANLTIQDDRSNRFSTTHSYRACIYDAIGNLQSSNSATYVRPRDKYMVGFSCATGTEDVGDIICSFNYPTETAKFKQLELRRVKGNYKPSRCDVGDVVLTKTSGFLDETYTDTTPSTTGETYSYRVCVTDQNGIVHLSNDIAERIRAKIPTPPSRLALFRCETGKVNFGEVDCTVQFPSAASEYAYVDIRHLQGRYAPNSSCTDGTVVKKLTPPFADLTFSDDQSADFAGYQGYRACIYDGHGTLQSYDTATYVRPRSSYLTGFACQTGTNAEGDIVCDFDYPDDTTQFKTVELRRQKGSYEPSSCSGGDLVLTKSAPFADESITDQTGSRTGETFSYRVCVTNQNGDVHLSGDTARRIAAKRPSRRDLAH